MRLAQPHAYAQAIVLCIVVILLLACLASALLVGGAARPVAIELPVWFGTTLLVKAGPAANCPTPFACAIVSTLQRPGLSFWLIMHSPDPRKIGWHKLLFLPSD